MDEKEKEAHLEKKKEQEKNEWFNSISDEDKADSINS